MTNTDLAKSYIWKAETRIDALEATISPQRTQSSQRSSILAQKPVLSKVEGAQSPLGKK
jgi:hypothetical protein